MSDEMFKGFIISEKTLNPEDKFIKNPENAVCKKCHQFKWTSLIAYFVRISSYLV